MKILRIFLPVPFAAACSIFAIFAPALRLFFQFKYSFNTIAHSFYPIRLREPEFTPYIRHISTLYIFYQINIKTKAYAC